MLKLIWKEVNLRLSAHLHHNEFKCKCTYEYCTFTYYSTVLVDCFELLRTACGDAPLKVNSGFRCQKHNADEKGKPTSKHPMGYAIDISCPSHLTVEEFAIKAREAGFDFVLEYPEDNFIHCQINP